MARVPLRFWRFDSPFLLARRGAALVALSLLFTLFAMAALPAAPSFADPEPAPPSILLITLDTTRADALGCYGNENADTPELDALARGGVRFHRALAPAPLTAPSHASMLTGLTPPEHGVRDNGIAALPDAIPFLPQALAQAGYDTAAFVGSRVLDGRFGLSRGFATYDDRMAAERVGEYGYPERDAVAVTTAAVRWLEARSQRASEGQRASEEERAPYFLWVHYYDPHLPYEAPALFQRPGPRGRYLAEVSYVDAQLENLLEAARQALPAGQQPLIAVAGDHGESLGEHGEAGHGIFIYDSVLRVPLILHGPGVRRAEGEQAAGEVVKSTVALKRLAPTLAKLAGVDSQPFGEPLPGWSVVEGEVTKEGSDQSQEPVYSESRLPRTAYGWAPLVAMSGDRYRLISAPRPELYDVVEDPGELNNLLAPSASEGDESAEDEAPKSGAEAGTESGAASGAVPVTASAGNSADQASPALSPEAREAAGRLKRALDRRLESFQRSAPPPAPVDAELRAAMESLGYLAGATEGRRDDESGGLDAKDGILLLQDFDRANLLAAQGQVAASLEILERLVAANPENVPFLSRLGSNRLAAGDGEGAVEALRRAVELNPRLSFLHLRLADAYRALGQQDLAAAAFRAALALDPKAPGAWLALAQQASQRGEEAEERRILEEAVEVGTASAFILTRLGQMLHEGGELEGALRHLDEAAELLSQWPVVFYVRAVVHEESGNVEAARSDFQRTTVLAPNTAEGRDARRRLQLLPASPPPPSP
ncbi:MAG: sulfatase-like hydrolase/transferase [Acidobacteriota bacterium]